MTDRRRVRGVLIRAGLSGPKLGPHMLRHTFASLFIRNSGNLWALARLLGHTSIRMSERYVALDFTYLAEEHRKHSPLREIANAYHENPPVPAEIGRIPPVSLPRKVRDCPLYIDGRRVKLSMATTQLSRDGASVYAAFRANIGQSQRVYLASITLPNEDSVIASYRVALGDLNARREERRAVGGERRALAKVGDPPESRAPAPQGSYELSGEDERLTLDKPYVSFAILQERDPDVFGIDPTTANPMEADWLRKAYQLAGRSITGTPPSDVSEEDFVKLVRLWKAEVPGMWHALTLWRSGNEMAEAAIIGLLKP